MKTPGRVQSLLWWVALGAIATGCQMQEEAVPVVPRPSIRIDPCADRLHDICGHLLLYYSVHQKLPPGLEDLKSTGDFRLPLAVCPASGKAYIYDRAGLPIRNRKGRLVLYDPEPSHSGMRWGILVSPLADGADITARVILVAEEDMAHPR